MFDLNFTIFCIFFPVLSSLLISFLEITTAENVLGFLYDSVHIECSGLEDVDEAVITKVIWADRVYNSDQNYKLIYDSTVGEIDSEHPERTNYRVNHDYQLTVVNVSIADVGRYECHIYTEEGEPQVDEFDLSIVGEY